jgi:hypothetical protein
VVERQRDEEAIAKLQQEMEAKTREKEAALEKDKVCSKETTCVNIWFLFAYRRV